jgi:hypothetical protein
MHKNATKCNKTQSKWCINKHGASKIIDTFETYQLASKWQGPLVIQDVYRSGAIRLHEDMKGKPHVVNGQCLKHYIAGKSFVGKLEVLNLQTPKDVIAKNSAVTVTPNQ